MKKMSRVNKYQPTSPDRKEKLLSQKKLYSLTPLVASSHPKQMTLDLDLKFLLFWWASPTFFFFKGGAVMRRQQDGGQAWQCLTIPHHQLPYTEQRTTRYIFRSEVLSLFFHLMVCVYQRQDPASKARLEEALPSCVYKNCLHNLVYPAAKPQPRGCGEEQNIPEHTTVLYYSLREAIRPNHNVLFYLSKAGGPSHFPLLKFWDTQMSSWDGVDGALGNYI